MRVVLDRDLCEANARCVGAAPEVFQIDEDEYNHVLIENPGEELRRKIEDAARLCPRQAISILDD